MATSLSSLITAMSKDTVLSSLLTLMRAAGFPTTSWASTSVPRSLLEVFAQSLAEYSATVAKVARSGFLSLAEDGWLDLLASEFFGLTRNAAVTTLGTWKIKDNGAGPHTLTSGAVWFSDSSGRRFVYVGPTQTLPLNTELDIAVQAESPGASWNILSSSTLSLVTSLPTVTVTNPPVGTTATWITTQGVNQETDAALRRRCLDKWSSIGAGVKDAYVYHCKQASTQVTKVRAYEATPSGGKVTVYVAGPDGALDGSVVSAVYAYLKDGRVPLCVTPIVYSVTNRIVPYSGEVTVAAANLEAVKAAIEAQVKDHETTIDIGGIVRVDDMITRVKNAGAINFKPLRPDGSGSWASPVVDDLALGPQEYAKFTVTLTYVVV